MPTDTLDTERIQGWGDYFQTSLVFKDIFQFVSSFPNSLGIIPNPVFSLLLKFPYSLPTNTQSTPYFISCDN